MWKLNISEKFAKIEYIDTYGMAPEPRFDHGMVYYNKLKSIIICGGR